MSRHGMKGPLEECEEEQKQRILKARLKNL